MDYVVIGINHKTAPVNLREKLAFPQEGMKGSLHSLMQVEGIEEGLILSTCNRVEIYAAAKPVSQCVQGIKNFLSRERQVDAVSFEPHLYGYQSMQAVLHGFRVASSLDSMVVGETQIMGQVKEAYSQALESKTTGVFLHRFLHRAIHVAKKVRSETSISHGAVSVGSAGVELAKKIFGQLSEKKVALLGTGKIGNLVLRELKEEGVSEIQIFNRTLKDDSVQSLDSFWKKAVTSDVIITSLGGEDPFVTRSKIIGLMEQRKHNPIFIIDLGVPRNVECEVNAITNVYLYNIDDLQHVISTNLKERQNEALRAEEIVEKEASKFYETMIHREPIISQLSLKFHQIRERELERTMKHLSHLSPDDRAAIEKCAEAIVTKILHDPILMLRSEPNDEKDWSVHQLLRKLFRLEE